MTNDKRVLALVLAGGRGRRLYPLTKYRSKPAVPVFGKYRIIDFVLSNLVNSGVFSIYILTQYRAQSLADHIEQGWQFGSALRSRDFFVSLSPAQMWTGEHWYLGTADAVYQNLHLVATFDADIVLIFSADHVYKMDIRPMLEFHMDSKADLTVAAYPIPITECHRFGVIDADNEGRIKNFIEKPQKIASELQNKPGHCLASMGNYVFKREVLEEVLIENASRPDSTQDFGHDIIPWMVTNGYSVYAYDITQTPVPGEEHPYWKDIGTIDSYWQVHMDALQTDKGVNLYNQQWPIRTVSFRDPPPRILEVNGSHPEIINAMIAEGTQVMGATIKNSIIGRGVIVEPGALVEDSVLFYGVYVGKNAVIRKTIIDKRVVVPEGSQIGVDREADLQRGYTVSEDGITVVPAPPPKLRINEPWPVQEK